MLVLCITGTVFYLSLRRLRSNKRIFLVSVVSLMSVYIVLFTLLVYYSTGEATMGSDMARYFSADEQMRVLSSIERALSQSETSNTFFYAVNYLARLTSPSDVVAILSIRLANVLIFACAYLSALALTEENEKYPSELTVFDYVFLLMPFGIMTASRNVRDVYILYCILELVRMIFSKKTIRFRLVRAVGFAVMLYFLRDLLLPILIVVFAVIKLSGTSESRSRKILKSALGILAFFSVTEALFRHSEGVRKTIWGVLFYFSDFEYSYVMSLTLLDTLTILLNKALFGIPYLLLVPSPFNDISFLLNQTQDALSGYLPYELVLVVIQGFINFGFVFPCFLSFLFGARRITSSTTRSSGAEKGILGVLIILILVYAATVTSPHFRTRFLIIETFVLWCWLKWKKEGGPLLNKPFLTISASIITLSIIMLFI